MNIEIQTDLYIREKYLIQLREFYHETEIIKVIIGIRRFGKNSLLKTIIKELLDSRIDETENREYRPLEAIT